MGLIFLPISSLSEKSYSIQCAVSYSEEKAQELVECLQSGGADCATKIGRLLGYPSCCTEFLSKYSGGKESLDSIFISAKKTKGATVKRGKGPDGKGIPGKVEVETVSLNASPKINILLRNFGIKTIPHIPCSLNCGKSREMSQKFLELMPSRKSLLKFLSEPMTWDEYRGVAIIDTKWFRGATQSIFHDDKIHHIISLNKNV